MRKILDTTGERELDAVSGDMSVAPRVASQNSCGSDACALFLFLIQCGERRRLGRPLCCDCSQRLMAKCELPTASDEVRVLG